MTEPWCVPTVLNQHIDESLALAWWWRTLCHITFTCILLKVYLQYLGSKEFCPHLFSPTICFQCSSYMHSGLREFCLAQSQLLVLGQSKLWNQKPMWQTCETSEGASVSEMYNSMSYKAQVASFQLRHEPVKCPSVMIALSIRYCSRGTVSSGKRFSCWMID